MHNVLESDLSQGLCAIKFTATWCGPCKNMNPIVDKLESEFKNVKFFSVDVDDALDMVQKYQIKSLPILLILKDGQEINRIVGVSLIEPLRKIFRGLTNV